MKAYKVLSVLRQRKPIFGLSFVLEISFTYVYNYAVVNLSINYGYKYFIEPFLVYE